MGWGADADIVGVELPVLGCVAVPFGPVFGLRQGEGCGAAEGEGAVWGGG